MKSLSLINIPKRFFRFFKSVLREFIFRIFGNYLIKKGLYNFLNLSISHSIFELLPLSSNFLNSSINIPKNESILIIAPHPDDEVIGLGGTIQLLKENNCEVHVAYVTTGQSEKKAKIKVEAIDVCNLLGIQYTFLSSSPGSIGLMEGKKLEKLIRELNIKHLFSTFLMDDHDDHKRVNQVIYKFLKDYQLQIWMYQIYTSLPANCVIDITKVADEKYKVLSKYTSVRGERDWVHYSKGCDMRNSRFLKNRHGLYAESFLVIDSFSYYEMCDTFFSNRKNLIYKTKAYF
jgi:LmbE family N-acetylglucosaminyl deacetylase